MTAITKKDANHAAQDVGYVKERHPEVTQILGDFKFHGQGQKKTRLDERLTLKRDTAELNWPRSWDSTGHLQQKITLTVTPNNI